LKEGNTDGFCGKAQSRWNDKDNNQQMQDARWGFDRLTNHTCCCFLIIHNSLNYKTANVKKFAVTNLLLLCAELPLFLIAVFYCGGS